MELRGIRNKESIEGKESSGKRYVLERMFNQWTTVLSYSFRIVFHCWLEIKKVKKVKVYLEFILNSVVMQLIFNKAQEEDTIEFFLRLIYLKREGQRERESKPTSRSESILGSVS